MLCHGECLRMQNMLRLSWSIECAKNTVRNGRNERMRLDLGIDTVCLEVLNANTILLSQKCC